MIDAHSVQEAWREMLDILVNEPDYTGDSRAGGMREIIGFSCSIPNDPVPSLPNAPARNISKKYAIAELLWYLSGSSHAEWMIQHAPQYERFTVPGAEGGRVAEGAYGPAIRSGIGHILKTLKARGESRQAVLPIFSSPMMEITEDAAHPDIPCTIALQFLVRNGALHMIVTMRSNDVWLGFPYDHFCFTMIQRFLASALGAPLGVCFWQAGSLHLYTKNAEKARACLVADVSGPVLMPELSEIPSQLGNVGALRMLVEGHDVPLSAFTSHTFIGKVLEVYHAL